MNQYIVLLRDGQLPKDPKLGPIIEKRQNGSNGIMRCYIKSLTPIPFQLKETTSYGRYTKEHAVLTKGFRL